MTLACPETWRTTLIMSPQEGKFPSSGQHQRYGAYPQSHILYVPNNTHSHYTHIVYNNACTLCIHVCAHLLHFFNLVLYIEYLSSTHVLFCTVFPSKCIHNWFSHMHRPSITGSIPLLVMCGVLAWSCTRSGVLATNHLKATPTHRCDRNNNNNSLLVY